MNHKADKAPLRQAIIEHVRCHGARDWNSVKQRFPHLSDSTFFRELRKVIAEISAPIAAAEVSGPVAAQLEQMLPAHPELGSGKEGHRFEDIVNSLLAAAAFAEAQSIRVVNAQPMITNAALFQQAQRQKLEATHLAARYADKFVSIEEASLIFTVMKEEMHKLTPSVAKAFFTRASVWGDWLHKAQDGERPCVQCAEGLETSHLDYEWLPYQQDARFLSGQRLALLLRHCEMHDSEIVQSLDMTFENLAHIKSGAGSLDVSRIVGFATLPLVRGARLHIDWVLTGRDDAFISLNEESKERVKQLNAKIQAEARKADLLRVPKNFPDLPWWGRRYASGEAATG